MKKNRKIILKKIKNRRNYLLLAFIILFFPLIIRIVALIPCLRPSSSFYSGAMNFYAGALCFPSALLVYKIEERKTEREQRKNLRPNLLLKLEKNDSFFTISIENLSTNPLKYIYFYDEFVQDYFKGKSVITKTISFSLQENGKVDYNITGIDCIDEEGYPKYIQILCDDQDGNGWDCSFHKVKSDEHVYYYPDDFYII